MTRRVLAYLTFYLGVPVTAVLWPVALVLTAT